MLKPITIELSLDFDLTMTQFYQQEPLLKYYYGLIGKKFNDKSVLEYFQAANERFPDQEIPLSVMQAIIADLKEGGVLAGLSNNKLYELGQEISPAVGIQEFFPGLEKKYGDQVHFVYSIISLGFKPMVQGFLKETGLDNYVKYVEASSFSEDSNGVINGIDRVIKAKDKFFSINSFRQHWVDQRYDPFIYISDNDHPVFKMISVFGGMPICVYPKDDPVAHKRALEQLEIETPRLPPYGSSIKPGAHHVLPRDFSPEGEVFQTVCKKIDEEIEIAETNRLYFLNQDQASEV